MKTQASVQSSFQKYFFGSSTQKTTTSKTDMSKSKLYGLV